MREWANGKATGLKKPAFQTQIQVLHSVLINFSSPRPVALTGAGGQTNP